jgi:hypothetical protein
MHYHILGDEITIRKMARIKGSVFSFSGSGLTKFGLPNNFYFQMPCKIAPAGEENIDEFGNLTNVVPLTVHRKILSIFMGKNIWNGKIVDQYSEPFN